MCRVSKVLLVALAAFAECLVFGVSASAQSGALTAEPVRLDLIAEPGERADFDVGGAEEPTYFEISVFERRPKDQLVRLVDPPVRVLPPMGVVQREEQSRIALEWNDPPADEGRLLVIFIDEIPLAQQGTSGAGLDLKLSLGVAVLANPRRAEPLTLTMRVLEIGSDGEVLFNVTNDAASIAVLSRGSVAFNEGSSTDRFALEPASSDTYVFPGETRQVRLLTDAPLVVGQDVTWVLE